MHHDVVVIGASAGGLEVLLGLVGELPAGLPAAVFVTAHTAPGFVGQLPDLLSRRGPLRASHAVHGEAIEHGRIYIAPSDNQLYVRPGFVEVVRGPAENGHRPAVDPLFRTASWAYGPRVIGVVLSGYQDCGTAGMMSVRARGGIAIAQAPGSAVAAEMPSNVIERAGVDHIVEPAELAGLLVKLVNQHAASKAPEVPQSIRSLEGDGPTRPAELVCPLCHGVLSATKVGSFEHFRCHVGHTFSRELLAQHQGEELERALWAAVRALEESSTLSKRLATSERDLDLQRRFSDKAATLSSHAETIRGVLLDGNR